MLSCVPIFSGRISNQAYICLLRVLATGSRAVLKETVSCPNFFVFSFPKNGIRDVELNKFTIVTKEHHTHKTYEGNMLYTVSAPFPYFELAMAISNFRETEKGK